MKSRLQVTAQQIADYLYENDEYDYVNDEHKGMTFDYEYQDEEGNYVEDYAMTYYDKRIYVTFSDNVEYFSKMPLYIDANLYEIVDGEIVDK